MLLVKRNSFTVAAATVKDVKGRRRRVYYRGHAVGHRLVGELSKHHFVEWDGGIGARG